MRSGLFYAHRGSARHTVAVPAKVVDRSTAATRAAELLRSVGQRVTNPRLSVLSCVLAAGSEHLSADEILDKVTATEGGSVHRATVYRTLDGLTAAGVLCHVHLDRGLTAYHLSNAVQGLSGAPHLHAQCVRCGRIVDLPPGVMEDVAARIRKARGFRFDPAHVALSGTCAECATAAAKHR